MAADSNAASSGPAADSATGSSTVLTHRQRTQEDFQKVLLDRYVTRDLIYSAALLEEEKKRQETLSRGRLEAEDYKKVRNEYRQWFPPSRLYGQGYNGYGNGTTDGQTKVVYPSAKPRLGHKKTSRLRIKRKEMAQQAEQEEELVPVRLDVEWDKIRLRDTFTWNLHDRVVPPELFAAQLVEDLGLSQPVAEPVFEQVKHQIHEQLGEFYPPVYIEEDALDPELPYSAYKNDEMRILIKLNITIGPHTLEDKFEWEINNPLNSPEEFAQCMTRDLSLSGEFATAIAHCIREQSQLFTKSLYIVGHPFDGRPLEDQDLIAAFLPSPLPSVFRPQQQAKEYGPYLYELSEADLERNEVIFSREQRRQKRSVNRRGGPSLPDLKDRPRTIRTLIVSSVLPGAAETIEESRMYKRTNAASGKKRAPGTVDGNISDSSDSDESIPDSPALSQLQGTARTRGMRGAATAAQQRMANLGRSETPEVAALHHHETRTSSRRLGRDAREESPEPPPLIIKLKISREKLRKLMRDLKSGNRASTGSQNQSLNLTQSGHSTPAPGSMGPPSTPGLANQSLSTATATTPSQVGQIGAVDAPPPPPPGQPAPTPPPPPQWLTAGLLELQKSYPGDSFEGMMRYSAVNSVTETPVTAPQPGKLYTPGPNTTVDNFEVHLKNRFHRERVDARVAASRSGEASSSGAAGGGGSS
ncbi:hypothetical protein B7463_g12622, partial [Scytalidium lignicola]